MSLRDLEAESIRAFVQAAADRGLFTTEKGKPGRVLDLGCGRMPYRSIVEATGAAYEGWDRAANPGSVVTEDVGDSSLIHHRWDAILVTQVLQYVSVYVEGVTGTPIALLNACRRSLGRNGWLVITGATNWPVIEDTDLWRFTPNGIKTLLGQAGFKTIEVTERAAVEFEGERWATGWGAVARA